ncbi:uncharacterized protein LOC144134526 [Amblyomma americanum]
MFLHRTQLAALHYNENADRLQGRTSLGEQRWAVKYPKGRKSKPVACPFKEPATNDYIGNLLEIVEELLDSSSFGAAHLCALPPPPPPLTSYFDPVDKAALVRDHLKFCTTKRQP